jgi:hypothetical protein
VGGGPEYEVSPSSANLDELVPPPFAMPISPYNGAIFVFLEGTWTREIKYVKKGIIVEIVDRCPWWLADPRWVYLQVNNIARERAYLLSWDPQRLVGTLRGEGIDTPCDLLSISRVNSRCDGTVREQGRVTYLSFWDSWPGCRWSLPRNGRQIELDEQ